MDWACRVALEHRLFRYKVLRRLAEQAEVSDPTPVPALVQSHELIRDLFEYAKEVNSESRTGA